MGQGRTPGTEHGASRLDELGKHVQLQKVLVGHTGAGNCIGHPLELRFAVSIDMRYKKHDLLTNLLEEVCGGVGSSKLGNEIERPLDTGGLNRNLDVLKDVMRPKLIIFGSKVHFRSLPTMIISGLDSTLGSHWKYCAMDASRY